MTTDLEELMRDTFAGRAAAVNSGPEWTLAQTRRPVNRWLVAAAAAAVVAAAGTAVVATGVLGRHRTEAASGSVRPTCHATLPSAWKRALAGPRWTVDGIAAWPDAIAKDGAIVSRAIDPSGTSYRTSLITRDGHATALLTVPRRRLSSPWGVDTDGRYAVYNFAPDEHAGDSSERPINDVVLIDARTGQRRHLLPAAPVPSGYVVAWRGAVIQAGTVYWGMQEAADEPARGIVVAYDIARRRYRVLAHLHESSAVLRDPRGVHWANGLVPAAGVPRSVPVAPATLQWRQSVESDGTSYAWTGRTDAPDARVVYWLHATKEHHWQVVGALRQGRFIVSTVSGPFVFGEYSERAASMFVLDMRTGAMASLGSRYVDVADAAGSRVLIGFDGKPGTVHSVAIDTSKLPGLHC